MFIDGTEAYIFKLFFIPTQGHFFIAFRERRDREKERERERQQLVVLSYMP